MKYMHYLRNYKFFICYFSFFFFPKIKLTDDIYVWPFEIFLISFIFYFVLTSKKIYFEKTLFYPLLFFLILIPITGFHVIIGNYEYSTSEFFRNVKFILYFLSFLLMYSYLYRKYYTFNSAVLIHDILILFVYFSSLIMCLMLIQICYNFIINGIPTTSELIWNFSSNQRPYLYAGRYFSTEGIKDIIKGNSNSTGILATLVFFISCYLYKKFKVKKYIITSIISMITLLMSFSRSSFIVFSLLLFMYLLFGTTLIKKVKFFILVTLIAIIFLNLFNDIIFTYTILSKFKLTFDSIESGSLEGSALNRVEIWKFIASGDLKYTNLLFGNGFGANAIKYFTTGRYVQLESLLLNILCWGGLFSFFFVLFYINLISKSKLLKVIDFDLYKIFVCFFLVFILPNVFTGGDLIIDATLHYLFPLFFAILYNSRKAHYENPLTYLKS